MRILVAVLAITRIVDGQDISCLSLNITKGETLESDCANYCSPITHKAYDWAAPNEIDPNIIDRSTVCRCLNDDNATTFECLDVDPGVWDTSVGVKKCDEYNITSGPTCKEFCAEIDPLSFDYSGSGSNLQCFCGTPLFQICGTSGSARNHDLLATAGSAILLATAMVFSFLFL